MTPLSDDQRKEVRATIIRWMLAPFLMSVVTLGLILAEQTQTTTQIERDTVRSELSDIDHRIKQEECLIRPFRDLLRRAPSTAARDAATVCDPDEALPDLRARRDRLDERLREMGGYEVRK